MPRQERSAGFILFRSEPTAPGGRVFLLLDYGRHWDYAKGHVEKGESDLDAAIRELREETGIVDPRVINGFSHEIIYYFRSSKHGLIKKRVIFFLGETDVAEVVLSHEHVGAIFLDYESAMKRLSYSTARDVLRKANEFLSACSQQRGCEGESEQIPPRHQTE
jgi:bis(5'-nucleosidyl)-tetraphosphatase